MYKRRLKIFLALMAAGVAVVIGRLAHLQLVHGSEYREQAERMLTYVEMLPTARGRILDCKGRVLACDEPCFDFCLDYRLLSFDKQAYDLFVDRRSLSPANRWVRRRLAAIRRELPGRTAEQARQVFLRRLEHTWELAATITGAAPNQMARARDDVVRRVTAIRRICGVPVKLESQPHPIVRGLDEAQAVALRARLGEMMGASVRPSHRRWYPYGEAACHVIGRLGPVGREGLERASRGSRRPLEQRLGDYLSGDLAGETGVEKLCEDLPEAADPAEGAEARSGGLEAPLGLRGRRGYRQLDRTTEQVLKEVPSRRGWDVQLTVDIEFQRALADELRLRLGQLALPGRCGAVVVIDVPTGEVRAMVSLPTFNPNEYRKAYARLADDSANLPLWDRTVSVLYPPGSTFKPLTALAGLHLKVISPNTTFHCRGYMHEPHEFRCWNQYGHGDLAVLEAIEHSCNVFFYHLGERLGLRRNCKWLTELGFADVPGTGLPHERPGRLPDPRRNPYAGEARFLAMGQGKVLATPMHVANGMAALARGGEFRTPLVVKQLRGKDRLRPHKGRQQVRRLSVSPQHVALVHEGMYRVVNSPTGTAYKHYQPWLDPQTQICGKTGTATTSARVVDGQVARSGDTLWFVGFAPYRNPRIAFAVVVEYATGGGGRVCAPIAREVVRICRDFGYL